jgi:DNA-binding transcriptional ArsR family regulator
LHVLKAKRDVFQAIADPTRREIIKLVAGQPYHVNAIAEKFDMSRQAVSLHLKILVDCGLVVTRQDGRNKFCEARLDQLDDVASWVDQSKKLWVGRFEKLDKYLAEIKKSDNGKRQ